MIHEEGHGFGEAMRRRWRERRVMADLAEVATRWCLKRYPGDPLLGALVFLDDLEARIGGTMDCPSCPAQVRDIFARVRRSLQLAREAQTRRKQEIPPPDAPGGAAE